MSLTPEAKKLLAETIRGTLQDPERGLRARLLRAIHDEADRKYRLSVAIENAGLDEAHHRRRERIEAWIEERTRAAKPKNKTEEKFAKSRLLVQAEQEAAATLINRLVVIRQLEALGLSKPAVLTGGWNSKGYREFQEFGRTLCTNGTADATEGYGALLQLVFDELAIDVPGLFGDVGLTRLFGIPAATLRDVVEKLDAPELVSAWTDDTTLGWIYQYWNDFERDALDEKILAGGKVEPHELASKTQMFTDRYIVEWLLQNSLGATWLSMCKKHGWTSDAEKVLPVLDARRIDWRRKRETGEVSLDALMPIGGELEDHWKYYVHQPVSDDAFGTVPDSLRALKLLDPAVGSGHFLVIAFDLLTSLYREEARHRMQTISDREIAESIVENNLHGIDIDPRAIQIAAAGLYLKVKSFARDAHPRRMNLVAPVLQLGNLPENDPAIVALRADLKRDVGIPETLTNKLVEAMAGVDYLGSLLKVDAAIENAIRTVEFSFDESTHRQPRMELPGSLASAKDSLLDRLETFLAQHSSSEDLGLRLDGEQLAAGVRFVRMVREGSYDVVVGNPPYQALSKTASFGYVATTYSRGKADLCAAFLERGLEFAKPHGLSAMVAMRNWMFLGQFSELRMFLLHEFDLRVLGDLDKGAFESMPTSQMISVAMTVFRSAARSSQVSVALQPTAPGEKYWGSDRTELKRAAILAQRGRFEFDPRGFAVIATEPIVYWWTDDALARYAAAPKLGDIAPVRQGTSTAQNARFLRRPWEVRRDAMLQVRAADVVPLSWDADWVPYVMGAAGRCWCEELADVVRWRHRGLELWNFSRAVIRNSNYHLRPGVAYATIGAEFSARAHRFLSIFSDKGASVFPPSIPDVVCSMNRTESRSVLLSLNPTVSFQVGDVERLPITTVGDATTIYSTLETAFTQHEFSRETSVEFDQPGASPWRYAQQWAQRAVDRSPSTEMPAYKPTYEPPSPESFVSFALGIALGRFDPRNGFRASPLPGGTLYVTAAANDSLDDPGATPLHAVWDEHGTAVGEGSDLRTYLRTSFFAYHNKLYEKRPIYFPLSSSRRNFVAFISIHRWQADTLGALLADHLMPTKRRLVGELDDLKAARVSGSNKRRAERRHTEVVRLLDELNEFIDRVTETAECGPPPPDDSTPARESEARYVMDLDDGVVVNSAALWALLEPQWKEPKKWWRELALAKGKKDYDWSQISARYFPIRVRNKCQDDPSLAVAHKCFWELHPAEAYAWELRLQDEIGPGFSIDEPDSAAARVKFLAEREREAAEILASEIKRRARKAIKAEDDLESGPLFEQAETDDEAGANPMTEVGAVSRVLEQDVLGEVRRQGIVIWLDKDESYTSFVDRLAARQAKGEFPFPVVGFRGSFLELLFQLEPYGNALDKQPLLIHMPGFNEESIRQTPILELYAPGVRYRKALDTLIREAATARVSPAEVERFVAKGPSLKEADTWLSSAVSQSTFGLAAALDEFGPKLLAEALGQPNSSLSLRVTAPEEVQVLRDYLLKLTGMDAPWVEFFGEDKNLKPLDNAIDAAAAWLLCVEYVHDLKRSPQLAPLQRLRALSTPVVKACCDIVAQVRRDNPDAYERIADEVEGFLAEELRAMTPEDLGRIDTFREEENRVLAGAVEALSRGEWSKAKSWCEARQGDKSFWLQRDQIRRWAWALVAEAAEFGETLARHPSALAGAKSLEQAAQEYASGAFEVDRAQRRFEQKRLMLLEPRLPHFGPLQEVVGALRHAYRAWADDLARAFATLCKDRGFLPPASHQQRTLYEQVIHPLTLTSDKVAVFLIDAFRYEMATELVEELKGSGTVVDLKPRLAELPTITSVGMNVLAPVAHGDRLGVAGIFQGFKTGEFTVRAPNDRARAMGMRSVGKPALLLKLADVCEMPTAKLTKDVKPHQLVVVHSKEIDDAGEANVGIPTFESTLRQIKAAWHHLQLAGVKNFVFTADHGFLLQDETTVVRPFGTKRDPSRRHVVDEHPRAEAGMVNVSMSSLGYDGIPGYLLFRDDTAVFATGTVGATFVHGGNSPQERIIPVLTVTRKHRETAGLCEYVVQIEALPDVVGLHRLRVRVITVPGTLGFVAAAVVDVAMRAPEREAVRATLKDVSGPAEIKTGRLQVPVGEIWSEVFFGLDGPSDDRVRVEVYHAENIAKVQSASPDQWYSVSGSAAGPAKPPPLAAQPSALWADNIADEGIRKVFLHIEKHGVVTESEVTALLGSPRAFRRFSLEFELHLAKLPFRVRIETAEGGKRYVREEDR